MTTAQWRPGTLYPTGSLCVPTNPQAGSDPAIPNYNFELGNQDWTTTSDPGSTTAIVNEPGYDGAWCVKHVGTGEDADGNVVGDTYYECIPGQNIPARCYGKITTGGNGASFSCVIFWYTAASVFISATPGSQVTKGSGTGWRQATVSAIAPPGAYKARIGASMNTSSGPTSTIYVDTFSWSYVSPAPAGLIYKAVQPTIGTSDAEEPVWPLTVGVQVTDGTVIWEAMIGTRVTYEASPILLSGETEPAWPESIGSFVTDNTISWEAVPQQVLQAPQSKVVTIASSKVYAADGDIVRYCATVNPLDWTSADDAGYLPTGLNQYGSNRTAVLNTYRGNVVPFSASTFLCYQADPDPANITQLDAMEGIGSTYQQAAHPVANDLFYLSPLGVRTVGIAVGTANLSAGDAGAPIDPLVQAALLPSGIRPLAAYYPNQGQYWLCMRPPLPVVEGPTITGDAPDGFLLEEYTPFQYTITLGDAPLYSVYVSDGSLPPGLSLSETGLLTGTLTSIIGSPFEFTVTAEDENGLTDSVDDSIAVTIEGAIPIPTIMTQLFFITGGGATNIAEEILKDDFAEITDTTQPWARYFVHAFAQDTPTLPPETRTLIYDEVEQGGEVVWDSGWHGDPDHQSEMIAALAVASLSAYDGTIQDDMPPVVYGTYESFIYASDPFVLPTNFATYSGRSVGYRYDTYMDRRIYLEFPDPAELPVGAVKLDAYPGYYAADGQLYVCDWTPT